MGCVYDHTSLWGTRIVLSRSSDARSEYGSIVLQRIINSHMSCVSVVWKDRQGHVIYGPCPLRQHLN